MNKINMIAGLFNAYSYESITVMGVVKALSNPRDDGERAKRAIITVETASCRYRYDGENPTASEGHLLHAGDVLTLVGSGNIQKFRIIKDGTANGTIRVTYEN